MALRLQLAKDKVLLSRVFRICMQNVFAWQRKRARSLGIADAKTPSGLPSAMQAAGNSTARASYFINL